MTLAFRLRPSILLLATPGALWSVSVGAEPSIDTPYYSRPDMAELMADVIFHVRYDDGTMKPDIAAGPKGLLKTLPAGWKKKPEPGKVYGRYAPGIVGLALRADRGVGVYAAQGNMTPRTSGAIAFWLKPLDWRKDDDRGIHVFRTSGGHMGMGRQAGKRRKDGKKLRGEMFAGWAHKSLRKGERNACVPRYGLLKNDQWYFVVLSWAWPTLSLSLDGGPFRTVSLPRVPDDAMAQIGSFNLGSRGGGAPTLIDEVMIFNRPLDAAEAKLICTTVRTWAARKAAARTATTSSSPKKQ